MVEIHPERYRSGHNGADSKSLIQFGTPYPAKPLFTKVFVGSITTEYSFSLHLFSSFCKVCFEGFDGENNTEGYRSGHNGADSKSVWVQAHVGSNPTPSAKR